MKFIILSLLLALVAVDAGARKIIELELEPALLEVKYERKKVLDTLDMDNDFRVDLLTLKIGKTKSAFYSAELKSSDSLEYRNDDYAWELIRNKELRKQYAKLPEEAVFKNYPEGKIRVLERYDLCGWQIDEDLEKPAWNMTDSIRNIMGYDCMLAVADFRGRTWEAWFSPDIPVSDGPWKLCGLPGLILEARDAKGHYTYRLTAIRNANVGSVEYFDYSAGNRFLTTREKSLPRKWKALHEDLGYKILTSGAYGVYRTDVKKRDHLPHTNYDFEETDYPHN